jgi:EH domain-containing protein 1
LDRFIAVVHGEESKTIKGNALTGVADLPFAGLSVFGSGFLNKFGAAVVPAPLLEGTFYLSYIVRASRISFNLLSL